MFHVKHFRKVVQMIERFLLWIKKGKGCKSCCLFCPYFPQCYIDVVMFKIKTKERKNKKWHGMI